MNPEQQYTACVAGLKEFVEGIGGHGVVLGLSGGIDSSLVACMCVDAFGAENVHGYMLPGPYSTEHSLVDAQELARNLGIRAERVSIAEAYRVFESQLSTLCPSFDRSTAGENTQARCRMIVLMALANFYGWTMVNTGNKSEAMMGYSTLYGDTAGAYAPIGGLYKTDVYAVSRWVNARAEAAGRVVPIPEHVLVKPPSAELAPGQQDETSLGTTYASTSCSSITKNAAKASSNSLLPAMTRQRSNALPNVWRRMRSSVPSSRNSPLFHTRNSVACGHIAPALKIAPSAAMSLPFL